MIYYNLESKYPGDVTKHCGLSIDEVDSNFYELEQEVENLKNTNLNRNGRLWAFSNPNEFPNNNKVETITDENNACHISGTVENGQILLGIDNLNLYGLSILFNGELWINGIEIPKSVYRIKKLSVPLYAELRENANEFLVDIIGGGDRRDKITLITNNRTLSFKIKYLGEEIINGSFVFDDDLVITRPETGLWLDNNIWLNSLIWTTDDFI